ncbi:MULTISPECIES: glycoside hydrolase family 3 N-terminal domain-containing protein [unclassified Rhodococcus (in: high G+C Gram-positive bacteria)]|uniref:glycoside hydrolase family 3 N-terminal domain-containing protein n=1 Tax=unclassified Rhodococcus (in: high G+C Gram-positive bacteria) TaxID=192944 RepID=UPI0024B864AF|nr:MULTISPECIES: glycoside hydrolase family 3 N-terminal domain-containing protein [unclassified Rhodococcus (in: high G+C Gram-positive bacteria)]MDI9957240.1 glycoside hydrolase family 3 N-terminal domain-containing protein [Rhodococcus sp. IEGM 1237]MDI9962219.1 glycoside hydrolase family 3 N-terminal domain-containing protein [Rhodococcus sp. IEGM 1251]MDV8125407.1 glycoside hydrolase family 3 N-terminal domain-containing protein [Rhodococcus sp. IEGM 1304]
MRIKFLKAATTIALCGGLVAGCSGENGTADPVSSAPTSTSEITSTPAASSSAPVAASCGSDLLASLSLRQKLAQLLNVGVTGTDDALSIVQNEEIGGIFVGSWTDQSMLTNREVPQVASASKLPLMVTIDEEGGRVSRVADILGPDPSARETAQTMTVEQTYQMALERGRGLKDLGITVNYAPDVDVSSQPDDSVIGDRSYSDDPQTVVAYAGAYAQGMRDAGIFPVIKHFPGHGSASGDSHRGEVTTPPLQDLIASDLIPFRELSGTGVGVMMGHLEVPGLTEPGTPASISPAAVALLRDGVGYGAAPFTGPVFTDDLSGMQAITDRYDIADAVQAALVAGVDQALWLTTDDVPRVLDHLEQAVASGELPQARVDQAVVTVATAKGAVTC